MGHSTNPFLGNQGIEIKINALKTATSCLKLGKIQGTATSK
jgi:hypothetical protein